MRLAISILLVAACSKHADNQCADAVNKGLDKMLAMRGSAVAGPIVEAMGKLKGVITNRCVEDKWSAEVIDCYAKSAGMADLRACRQKLPPDQQAKLQGEEMQVMMSAMGSARAPMPPHDDMGSAGSAGPAGSAPAPEPAPMPPTPAPAKPSNP